MSTWFTGPVKRRTVKLQDGNTALVQFSTLHRPVGSDVDLPPGKSSVTIDHSDAPIGIKVIAWQLDNDGIGVTLPAIDRFLSGFPEPGAREVGDAQIISEGALRKSIDGEGSEVEEHRFTLRVAFDEMRPFFSTPLGQLLRDKRAVLSLSEAQVDLPAMPAKVRLRKGAKPDTAEQPELNLGDSADDLLGD